MESSSDLSSITRFEKFSHRVSYHSELLIAYQIHPKLAIQFSPGYLYRNLTNYNDDNGLLNLEVLLKFTYLRK